MMEPPSVPSHTPKINDNNSDSGSNQIIARPHGTESVPCLEGSGGEGPHLPTGTTATAAAASPAFPPSGVGVLPTPTTPVRYALVGELYHRDVVVHVPVILFDGDYHDQLPLDWDQDDRYDPGHHEWEWKWERCFDDQHVRHVE